MTDAPPPPSGPLKISEDQMTAWLSFEPRSPGSPPLQASDMLKLLDNAGITTGIQKEALDSIARQLAQGQGVQDVPVAFGTPIRPGTDARLDVEVDAKLHAGEERDDGSVDYRKRQTLPYVNAGEVLVRKIPATKGQPGVTVTGKVIPARNGEDIQLMTGDHTQLATDGLSLASTIEGIVIETKGVLRVLDTYTVESDVDYGTGNVESPKTVMVRGTVRSAFATKTEGALRVLQSIEDAVIEAGDDVHVSVGIVQGQLGSLRTKRSVKAGFAQNARIVAGDSIVLRNSAVHCFLAAENSITIVEGKGVQIGGHSVAGKTIELRVAGSEMSVPTKLQIVSNFSQLNNLDAHIQDIDREMTKLAATGGDKLMAVAAANGPPPQDAAFAAQLKTWRELEQKKKFLITRRGELLETSRKVTPDQAITVRQTIHPGVEIIIGTTHLELKESLPGGRFYLDPKTNRIERVSL